MFTCSKAKKGVKSKMTKQSTDALYIDYHLAQQKFLDSKSTFMTKVREIREEINRGRYKPYAILEEGKIKVNKLVYCDYSTHRALLKDKNLRKTVPAFNGSEVALYTTEEKELVLLRDV